MELKRIQGDYVPDGYGGFLRVSGGEELLQRALLKLQVPRGSFPFLPELGSRLYLLPRSAPSRWNTLAEQYTQEALEGENLSVERTELLPGSDGGVRLKVFLSSDGTSYTLSLDIGG